MAYTAPTPADFFTRFDPLFDLSLEKHVIWALERAARKVDETWTEGDFAEARMLFAAHLLTLRGMGNGAEAIVIAQGGAVKRQEAADHKIEFFATSTPTASASVGELGSTSFGRAFQDLAVANLAGPMIAGGNNLGINHLARDFPGRPRLPWEP